MNDRKSNNSILIIATLGVYLGLMLAGAPASAFANPAATTRYFDIREEIEYAEPLDTDPDDLFGESIVALVKDLDRLSEKKKFDWAASSSFTIESLSFDEKTSKPSFLGGGNISNKLARQALEKHTLAFSRALLKEKVRVGAGKFHTARPEAIDAEYRFKDGISLTITVNTDSPSHAALLAEAIDGYLNTVSRDLKSRPRQIVKANTTSKVDDTKVIIATSLARSDISDILA